MNRKVRIEHHLLWVLLPGLLSLSCRTTPISIEDVGLSRSAPSQRIPLSVGLCLDDSVRKLGDLKNYAVKAGVTGELLSAAVQQASRNMFATIILLKNTGQSEDLSQKEIDAVVSVKLIRLTDNSRTSMRGRSGFPRGAAAGKAQVVMRWSIGGLDKKPIYFSQVRGEGRAWIPVPVELSSKEWKQAYLAALRDQFEKAQKDIVSGGWWKDQSWR